MRRGTGSTPFRSQGWRLDVRTASSRTVFQSAITEANTQSSKRASRRQCVGDARGKVGHPQRDAAMNKITNEILVGFVNCKIKGRLKLAREAGKPSEYEAIVSAAKAASREAALARLVARLGEGDACRGLSAGAHSLTEGSPILVDALIED